MLLPLGRVDYTARLYVGDLVRLHGQIVCCVYLIQSLDMLFVAEKKIER